MAASLTRQVKAGEYRDRVRIEQFVAGSPQQKPTGEPDEAWAELFTGWAKVAPLSGRELFTAQQINSEVTTRITMRYRPTVTAAMRAIDVINGTTYNIEAVVNVENAGIELLLYCSAGVNDG